MAEIVLTRVDQRVVHGVICVTWSSKVEATRIIAVDDTSAKNSFLKKIMEASSSLVPCSVVSLEQAVSMWKENQFGEGRILLIFKTIKDAYQAKLDGLDYKELQIGWITAEPQRVRIDSRVNLSKEEVDLLAALEETQDVKINLQYSPQFEIVYWRDAIKGKF